MPANGRWNLIRRLKVNLLLQSATRTVPNCSQDSPQAFQNIQCFPTDLNACVVTSVIRLAPSKRERLRLSEEMFAFLSTSRHHSILTFKQAAKCTPASYHQMDSFPALQRTSMQLPLE